MSAVTRLATVTLGVLAAASAAHAQMVHSVPNHIPSTAARIAQVAPNPTGLRGRFPAGLSDGSGAAVSTDPVAASTSPIPPGGSSIATTTLVPAEIPPTENAGSAVTTTVNGAVTTTVPGITNAAAVTTVMAAGATVRGPGQTPGGAGGVSATDAARAFFFADANHDGELTRAEFARLPFHTETFEEMDRNFDGVISRFEWEDSLR